MEIVADFPGGAQVDAHVRNFTVKTDQSLTAGGDDSAPTPFELFLASIVTCSGIYVLEFCKKRNLPADDVRVVLNTHTDPMTGMTVQADIEIQLPPSFPSQYYDAVIRSAELCKVKRHLENPPKFNVTTKVK